MRALSLLSVGGYPAVYWLAHYYALRQLLPCSRDIVLAQMVRLLFGPRSYDITRLLIQMLAQDLDTGLALHSLVEHQKIEPARIQPPLLVCHGDHDAIVDTAERWQPWLKSSDRTWVAAQGHHFFHFDQARPVAATLLDHWQRVDRLRPVSVAPALLKASH